VDIYHGFGGPTLSMPFIIAEAFRAAAISHICVWSVIKTQKLLENQVILESQMANPIWRVMGEW